jgi:hypothetical protein
MLLIQSAGSLDAVCAVGKGEKRERKREREKKKKIKG